MDANIKKVYTCFNKKKYNEHIIREILESEGYTYEFYVGSTPDYDALKECDEFWTFGDVDGYEEYISAKDIGKDIWVMG